MARQKGKKDKHAASIKLAQPDRSGPTDKTLLQVADEQRLFQRATERERFLKKGAKKDEEEQSPQSPRAERIAETVLWTLTMAMLHLTFDTLVQHQYATEVNWPLIWLRTGRAWLVFLVLFYPLHPTDSNPILIPGLPLQAQTPIRQAIFFIMASVCGPYLIHISNTYSYLAVMKQAPPLACLWLWAVIELDLILAAVSTAIAIGFMWWGGYTFA